MGFYAPATLVDDARRRGVDVRPVDVTRSDWCCTLEPAGGAPAPAGRGRTGAAKPGSPRWNPASHRAGRGARRGHPLAALREQLRARRLPDARTVSSMRNGRKTRYAGLVICRQRPGTAGGVVFMTLEDETGFVNLVVWSRVFDAHALVARTAPFLGVTGTIQRAGDVVNLVADTLWRPRIDRGPNAVGSRDFH